MFSKFLLKAFKYILILLVILIGIMLWIFRPFLTPSFLTGTNLIILTNEFEARPCGGFITAFGEISLFPPKGSLKNSYHFEGADLGPNTAPLDQIANDMKFWDLAIDSDLDTCTERIKTSYESLTETDVSHTVLINFRTIGRIFSLVAPMEFEGEKLTTENLFSSLSRAVADVDRHDEESLQKRKSPLSKFGKRMILKGIVNPFVIIHAGMIIRDEMNQGDIYISEISESVKPSKNDFVVREWNLGGAKSSRYLQKELKINFRQNIQENWNTEIIFEAEHLGHFDEPLSTDWTGIFEIQLPEFLGGKIYSLPTTIKPGSKFTHEIELDDVKLFANTEDIYELGVFRSRGQDLWLDLQISAYPQQSLKESNLYLRENVGAYHGRLKNISTSFEWKLATDSTAPFVTFHPVVNPKGFSNPELSEAFSQYDIVGEIHFNESVFSGSDVLISLQDKNHSDIIHNDPTFGSYEILDDQRTMIVGFTQKVPQIDERYFLHLTGIRDSSGNEIESGPWTLVVR